MPALELLKDGARQMTICNACRYCEGYCAVFPAMEQRRIFTKADLIYLANLCFDCRDCYYACQYAPPHEFAVNIPKVMAELRADTYREFAWPAILSGLFKRNGLAVSVITTAAVIIILGLVLAFKGWDILRGVHLGEGAFYRVVPFVAMTVPPSVIVLYGLGIFIVGALRFWRETQGKLSDVVDPSAFWRATKDAFGLAYMKGGGAGCNYPGESFSRSRLWFHHLVFYGFLLDFAATSIAAFYGRAIYAQHGLSFSGVAVSHQLDGHAAARAARDCGNGNSIGYSPGRSWRPLYHSALRQICPRRVPLRRAGTLCHRATARRRANSLAT